MNLKERARQLKVDIPAVFIAMKHRDTPIAAKALAALTVAYALSPIDLIPKDVFAARRVEAAGLWADGKPKKWFYAIPIVFVWLVVVYLIVKTVWL